MSVDNREDSDLAGRVNGLLARIEDQLVQVARDESEFVSEAAGHIIAAGGKRFRPALVVLTASLFEHENDEEVIRAALAVELTHVASLYHDDVMDEAELRRGTISANRRYENSTAILIGDFLFARASAVVADLGAEHVRLHSDTFARLVKGQIAETRGPEPGTDRFDHYLAVVADKTGSLISASAVYGGMAGGASAAETAALAAFGEEIGVVFQLSDDLIDITSTDSGKTPGTDLREGVLTLPTLYVLRSQDAADDRLRDLVSRPLTDEAEVAEALELLHGHPALDQARAEIARRAAVAESYLDELPAGPAGCALRELCRSVVTRSA